jgi:hypothetical protein
MDEIVPDILSSARKKNRAAGKREKSMDWADSFSYCGRAFD